MVAIGFETAAWALLQIQLPERALCNIAVILVDAEDVLHMRSRDDWWQELDDEGGELWASLVSDFALQAKEMGARRFVEWLETTASHAIRITAPQSILLTNVQSELEILYRHHVTACEEKAHPLRKRFPLFPFWKQRGPLSFPTFFRQSAAACLVAILFVPEVAFYAVEALNSFQAHTAESGLSPLTMSADFPLAPPLDLKVAAVPVVRQWHRGRRRRILRQFSLRTGPPVIRVNYVANPLPDPPRVELTPSSTDASSVLALTEVPSPPGFPENRNKIVRFLSLLSLPFRALVR